MIFVYLLLLMDIGVGILIYNVGRYDAGIIVIMVFVVILFFTGLVHTVEYFSQYGKIEEYKILKKMYEDADELDVRDATITRDIIKYNTKLAASKYWNKFFIADDWILDEYADLDYIGIKE